MFRRAGAGAGAGRAGRTDGVLRLSAWHGQARLRRLERRLGATAEAEEEGCHATRHAAAPSGEFGHEPLRAGCTPM